MKNEIKLIPYQDKPYNRYISTNYLFKLIEYNVNSRYLVYNIGETLWPVYRIFFLQGIELPLIIYNQKPLIFGSIKDPRIEFTSINKVATKEKLKRLRKGESNVYQISS
jgi:hypothetical protein